MLSEIGWSAFPKAPSRSRNPCGHRQSGWEKRKAIAFPNPGGFGFLIGIVHLTVKT
jgi:hypothetical protein